MLYIVLTTNYAECGGGDTAHILKQDGKSYYAGSVLYPTREAAEAAVKVLDERWVKTAKMVELMEETGAVLMFGNPFKTTEAPKFEVFELTAVAATDISRLPDLGIKGL